MNECFIRVIAEAARNDPTPIGEALRELLFDEDTVRDFMNPTAPTRAELAIIYGGPVDYLGRI